MPVSPSTLQSPPKTSGQSPPRVSKQSVSFDEIVTDAFDMFVRKADGKRVVILGGMERSAKTGDNWLRLHIE